MKAFINIIDNKVMLSKLPKPELPQGHYGSDAPIPDWQMKIDHEVFDMEIKEFNNSIIGEAENRISDIYGMKGYKACFIWIHDESSNLRYIIRDNQRCHVKGLTITELIND